MGSTEIKEIKKIFRKSHSRITRLLLTIRWVNYKVLGSNHKEITPST